MYITHSFFQQSELSFDIFKVVHHMLPHSSLPGACCSFSTQPQVPEASLLQVFIISSKHLHQSWCQEDYDSVCPGPVGLGLEAWKSLDLFMEHLAGTTPVVLHFDSSSQPLGHPCPASRIARRTFGGIAASRRNWNWGWRDWPWDQPTPTWEDPCFAWKHESIYLNGA